MEEIVYDTNQLIDCYKKGKHDINGLTTIFNVIEFPKAVELAKLTVIYPTIEDCVESLSISTDLLNKGSPLPAIDLLIATICIRRNLTLSTKDSHFTKIESVRKTFKLELIK
jgi:tRNA(fMet)-specific endonuclease VapC